MSEKVAGHNGDHATAKEPSCIDGLLWIGQTYPEFFCGSSESCVDPERPKGPHCFVHEADRRGISRRVPRVPPWAIPDESRIFLAHKGGEREHWKGRIFGYFTLGRVEVILPPDSPSQPGGPEDEPVRLIPDGKKEKPDEKEEPEGDGKKTKPTLLPHENETRAEHRGCSLRTYSDAVYLVDHLEAEITDAFARRLDRMPVRKRRDDKATKGLFNELVDEIAPRHVAKVEVPPCLRGKAHVRGELVLFDKPPLFEQRPQAAFRGLAHIDGKHLLEQIAAGVTKPEIHSCRKQAGPTTRREVIAEVAERAHANKALTRELLAELSGLAREELRDGKEFLVPDVGTLERSEDGQVSFLPSKALLKERR